MMVTSIFSFSNSDFYIAWDKSDPLDLIWIVI